MKIALAQIVKGTKQEAKVLKRCLESVKDHVDGIYITITQPSKEVEAVCDEFGANVSHFEWNKDFSDARNYNFSQVPKEYDFILWLDADDVVRDFDKVRAQIDDHDIYTFNYLYHFDENNDPDVIHLKSRIVRNDGCVTWQGGIHEDLIPNRDVKIKLITDADVLHLSNDTRVEESKVRNLVIALNMSDKYPDDPRTYWNLGNAYKSTGDNEKSIAAFEKFFATSESEEEKYIARLRAAEIYINVGKPRSALEQSQIAIGMYPEYPDGYNMKGHALFDMNKFEDAAVAYKLALMKKPPKFSINVYNPRDYDFFPLLALAKCYINLSMPMLAEPCLEGCLKVMPRRKDIKDVLKIIKKEGKVQEKVMKTVKELEKVESKEELKKRIEALPLDQQSHPAICSIRNQNLIKEESSGKDLVIYCYHTETVWNPEMAKTKGIGGSEEAVINLAKQWSDKGMNVTVYNNSGYQEQHFDGVTYKPTWMWNYRDKQDVVILWRTPKALDYDINADKVIVDVHDTIAPGEFNEARIKKVYKILVKTKAHRGLYPHVPDEKIEIIPNGMDFKLFNQKAKKDPLLMVNTSSPDRSLDVLPGLFKRVKERVPEAKLKWAYGWDIFDIAHSGGSKEKEWKKKVEQEMEEAGVENLGRLSQKEAAKLYLEANILAYPTEFFEIDCITVKKAQACGAKPITTDFGALEESVKTGVKVHSPKTKDNWSGPYQFHYGLTDEKAQQEWVDACVKQLKEGIDDRTEMKEKMERYRWETVAQEWYDLF